MKTTSQKGFTIIEIIIVLAIGALIGVIAFLGVPTAKRMMRDAQRKSDLGNTAIAFKAFASAHQGCLPTWLDNGTLPLTDPGYARPPVYKIPDDCVASYKFDTHAAGVSPMLDTSKLITGGYYQQDKYGIDPLARLPYQWHEIGPDYGNDVRPEINPLCTDDTGDPATDSRPTVDTPARIRYYREVDPSSLATTIPPVRTYTPHRLWLGICLETGEEYIESFEL